LGSQYQRFCMLLDTFNDATWVASVTVRSHAWQSKHKFDPSGSRQSREGMTVPHGTDFVQGRAVQDKLVIGEHPLAGFIFLLGEKLPETHVLPSSVDGVLGLARPSSAVNEKVNFWRQMKEGLIRPIFGIKLCPREDPSQGTGELVLGSVCHQCKKGPITQFHLLPGPYWSFEIEQVSVNDWVVDAQKTVVIMDTSTGYIHGPERTVAEINSMIDPVESTGTFTFVNCDTWLALPTISFSGSFEELKFTPNDYVIKTTDGKCMSVFVSSKSDERFWRFGIAAHRHRYVIYNEFRKLVEFAAAKCP
ncbi:Gastricsin, partial [Clonorchis sinensis]